MTQVKMAIDLDDVCFDFMEGFRRVHGPPTNPSSPILGEMYPNLTVADVLDTVNYDKVYELSPMVPMANTYLSKLAQSGLVYLTYVSARPKALLNTSIKMLKIHRFPHPNRVVLLGSNMAKAVYIVGQKFEIVLDDRFEIIENVAKYVKFAYLFDRPWNQGKDYPLRVANWEAFFDDLTK